MIFLSALIALFYQLGNVNMEAIGRIEDIKLRNWTTSQSREIDFLECTKIFTCKSERN